MLPTFSWSSTIWFALFVFTNTIPLLHLMELHKIRYNFFLGLLELYIKHKFGETLSLTFQSSIIVSLIIPVEILRITTLKSVVGKLSVRRNPPFINHLLNLLLLLHFLKRQSYTVSCFCVLNKEIVIQFLQSSVPIGDTLIKVLAFNIFISDGFVLWQRCQFLCQLSVT